MKKYDTGLAPRKISMIDGPNRLGSEYTSPETQFPKERFAISRRWTGEPVSFRFGHKRSTKNKLNTTTAGNRRKPTATSALAPEATTATHTRILMTPKQ